MNAVIIRELEPEDVAAVSALAMQTFDALVGHELTDEGVAEYARYVDPDALRARQQSDHFTLVAFVDGQLAGMIEFRRNQHLSMLFVNPAFHRRGIARRLYEVAMARVTRDSPDIDEVTVNASRYAVPVYEKLGFTATGAEQTVNGIIFMPMAAVVCSPAEESGGTVLGKETGGGEAMKSQRGASRP